MCLSVCVCTKIVPKLKISQITVLDLLLRMNGQDIFVKLNLCNFLCENDVFSIFSSKITLRKDTFESLRDHAPKIS